MALHFLISLSMPSASYLRAFFLSQDRYVFISVRIFYKIAYVLGGVYHLTPVVV